MGGAEFGKLHWRAQITTRQHSDPQQTNSTKSSPEELSREGELKAKIRTLKHVDRRMERDAEQNEKEEEHVLDATGKKNENGPAPEIAKVRQLVTQKVSHTLVLSNSFICTCARFSRCNITSPSRSSRRIPSQIGLSSSRTIPIPRLLQRISSLLTTNNHSLPAYSVHSAPCRKR